MLVKDSCIPNGDLCTAICIDEVYLLYAEKAGIWNVTISNVYSTLYTCICKTFTPEHDTLCICGCNGLLIEINLQGYVEYSALLIAMGMKPRANPLVIGQLAKTVSKTSVAVRYD